MRRTPSSQPLLFATAAALSVTVASCYCTTEPTVAGPSLALPSRVAARSIDASCPEPIPVPGGEWKVEPVFQAERGAQLPSFLQGRCVYTWTGAGRPDPRGLPSGQLAELSEDPPVVIPLQATSSEEVRDINLRHRRALHVQAASPAALSEGQAVFVGFPDTSPSNASGAPLIPSGAVAHGFNMAWISRDLTCKEGGPCLTTPLTELALDQGAFGSRTGFARAIHTLVDRWVAAGGGRRFSPSTNPKPKRLVLDIASGWEPVYDCRSIFQRDDRQPRAERAVGKEGKASQPQILDEGGVLHYPTSECGPNAVLEASRDVYLALVYASCRGALVIAAAGNNPGYSNLAGPMSPAAWQRFPAPDENTCNRLGLDREPESRPAPLVHAVGGVDGDDWPIAVTRVGSRPPIVAPASLLVGFPESLRDGYGAAGCDRPPCKPSFPITGTSVAATVASSAAALVWAAHPEMSAGAVMRAVYDGGRPLESTAEVCFQDTPCAAKVHRVALCGAIACAGDASCAAPPECAPPANSVSHTAPPADIAPLVLKTNAVFGGSVAGAEIGGQPVTPCPPCYVALGLGWNSYPSSVHGSIDSSFFTSAGETSLRYPTLTLYTASRAAMATTGPAWNQPTWSITGGLTVTGGFGVTGTPASAWVSWTGGSGRLYSQEIPMR